MTRAITSAFALPDDLAAKRAPELIAADEQQFALIAQSLEERLADLSARLDAARRAPGGAGREALERDQEIHRLTARLSTLRRFGLDLCLGRMVPADGTEPVYVGRLGLLDEAGHELLIDWRSPAAEPFFGATHAEPMGLTSRRRYRWNRGRVSDYWDEVFQPEALSDDAARVALDDQSAFIASLGSSRSDRMRDVLGTLQADQDAIIRAASDGALVVDGGPGTGKTVVALHRAAYLLHADPLLRRGRGGVLVVGPHQPYLDYVADVLPSLGEDGVQTCTLRDLVPQGASAVAETDPQVASLKADARMVAAIEPAVRFYETPPREGMLIETPWADLWLSSSDWAEAYEAVEPGTPHNEAREEIRDALLEILLAKARERGGDDATDGDRPADDVGLADDDEFDAYGTQGEGAATTLRRALAANRELDLALSRAWPTLEAVEVVGDLWEVPAYLRRCAPWLTSDEVRALQRHDVRAWTVSDLPLLDAARQLLGDPDAPRRSRRHEVALARESARMADVVDDLLRTDDSDLQVMSMLRGQDMRGALVDGAVATAAPPARPDSLAGPFAHVVVDEAQELTDAE